MKKEVQSAVEFLAKLLRKRNVNADKVDSFVVCFEGVLCSHYQDHWFPEKPFKGSGYRCMRIVNRKMDPLIARAGAAAGLSEVDLLSTLPTELTLWVDPEEVSYRIGEEGSIGVLFDSQVDDSPQLSSDAESVSSGSLSSSPSVQDYLPYHPDPSRLFSNQYAARAYSPPAPYQEPAIFSSRWGDYLSTFVAS
ncbi:hypothetical protein LSH36_178g02051 [Paralvinella palmiformis]|uniref:Anti-proliferative protein domain-containing protein n=1 Tax=Paralvinella palmiformis TaxID=53620 RepID=A0AAD9JRV5_9ANNE|nr:hypothetical protein LSH36_178g02051 [Paralvinella palmiformis]